MASPKSILCLDMATTTGLCNWQLGSQPVLSFSDLSSVKHIRGKAMSWHQERIRKNIEENNVDLVVMEAPLLITRGPRTDNIEKLLWLIGLVVTTERLCYELDVLVSICNVQSWRKYIFGNGHINGELAKECSMLLSHSAGLEPKCHDEAEAFMIMNYVAHLFKLKTDWRLNYDEAIKYCAKRGDTQAIRFR